jgi:ABC-type lipopolysaccharide export system ATPase subunit
MRPFSFGIRSAEEGEGPVGGERNRLHLAKLLKSGGNLLLLDRPTNDPTSTLCARRGARRVRRVRRGISHDRWFDRIATRMPW